MPDSTYSKRVTQTTSLSNFERRERDKRAKLIAQGKEVPELPVRPAGSLRPGLRGVKYTYAPEDFPVLVRPRAKPTNPGSIPVPRLEGQEDIPASDSESEPGDIASAPLVQAPRPNQINPTRDEDLAHDKDDAQSQADTVIEECDNSGSSESGADGDDDDAEGEMEIEQLDGLSTEKGKCQLNRLD
ncbi:hypothetical protein FS749_016422 [Ceratobasidium sp. UAMH 11750]|nr:hypothetical protein FS749_016422 [Ceratobasidium sp. UAMH 11750]